MVIVTGYEGVDHVTSWQDRDLNQGMFGPDTYILNVGSKMAASIITNNEIHIADGTLVLQGCQGVIQKGTYDTITIANGSMGMYRNDLICAQYSKDGLGVESLGFVVVKGTAAASNPQDPSYTSGDIQNGDSLVQVPVYRVSLNGLNIDSVEALVPTSGGLLGLEEKVSGLFYADAIYVDSGSVASEVAKDVLSVTLDPGIYILHGVISYSVNSSGYRRATINGGQSGLRFRRDFAVPVPGVLTSVHIHLIETVTAQTTFTLEAYQNSGSSLDTYSGLQYVRLNG